MENFFFFLSFSPPKFPVPLLRRRGARCQRVGCAGVAGARFWRRPRPGRSPHGPASAGSRRPAPRGRGTGPRRLRAAAHGPAAKQSPRSPIGRRRRGVTADRSRRRTEGYRSARAGGCGEPRTAHAPPPAVPGPPPSLSPAGGRGRGGSVPPVPPPGPASGAGEQSPGGQGEPRWESPGRSPRPPPLFGAPALARPLRARPRRPPRGVVPRPRARVRTAALSRAKGSRNGPSPRLGQVLALSGRWLPGNARNRGVWAESECLTQKRESLPSCLSDAHK